MPLNHLSLFTGIGGFDLAAEAAGIRNVLQCEIEPFCLKVLSKNFPHVQKHTDIRTLTRERINEPIDIISGGFPCQPFSVAGKRQGKEDSRYLWPEMLRVIAEVAPTWVVGENVSGVINMALEQVCVDLEAQGYAVQPLIIPACSVEAPHKRERVWVLAHTNHQRQGAARYSDPASAEKGAALSEKEQSGNRAALFGGGLSHLSALDVADPNGERRKGRESQKILQERRLSWRQNFRSPTDFRGRQDLPEPLICRMDDGFSNRVDRLKGVGNAIVPQVAYELFKTIVEIESMNQATSNLSTTKGERHEQ